MAQPPVTNRPKGRGPILEQVIEPIPLPPMTGPSGKPDCPRCRGTGTEVLSHPPEGVTLQKGADGRFIYEYPVPCRCLTE